MRKTSKNMIRIVALVLLLAIVAGFIIPISSRAVDTSYLCELADSYKTADFSNFPFNLTTSSRFYIVSSSEPSGELLQTVQLAQRKFAAAGYPSSTVLPIFWGDYSHTANGDIIIQYGDSHNVASEGYNLMVNNKAQVFASDVDGLMYGLDMLLKHCRAAGLGNQVRGFYCEDAPDTAERVVSLDCGRKYYTKDWICNFIREMSWMGYNTLQLHFSDDSGFRMDFWDPEYYQGQFQPANDFSWICGSNYTSWTLSAYQNDAYQGKFLTTKEVVEILEVAKEYHIDVIPSFDSPAHMDYLTWTFEQYYDKNSSYSFYSTYYDKTFYASSNSGKINYTNTKDFATPLQWPYYAAINLDSEMAKGFAFELYTDIANFFKEYAGSTDFSVGADEVNLTKELDYGSFQWDYSDFVTYINDLNSLLNSKGYTMRMYNDFMGTTRSQHNATSYTFDSNIEIMYWNSPFNPKDGKTNEDDENYTQPISYFVNQNRTLYNCIQTSTYYALRKTSDGRDARGTTSSRTNWTFYHSTEQAIYNEWCPKDFTERGDYTEPETIVTSGLAGAYFLVWADYACVNTEKQIWDGVTERVYDSSSDKWVNEYYSLRDRMWSNITKMWNWEANSSVTFADFETIRKGYGTAPGILDCSAEVQLPTGTSPIAAVAENYTHTIVYKNQETGDTLLTKQVVATEGSFEIPLESIRGYKPYGAVGANYVVKGSAHYVQGYATSDLEITVWCKVAGDDWYLQELLRTAALETKTDGNITYTDASWAAYQSAITEAGITGYDSQEDIDRLVAKIQAARTALVTASDTTTIEVKPLAESYPLGKQVGLYVVTTPDVPSLTVLCGGKQKELTFVSAQVQVVGGQVKKCWVLHFTADAAGEDLTCTVTYGNVSVDTKVTIN